MTDKPKRKFWQFHLSTAIVLMIVSGGMMYVNFKESPHYWFVAPIQPRFRKLVVTRGWPYRFSMRGADDRERELFADEARGATELEFNAYDFSREGCLIVDALVGLGVVLVTGLVYEWLIRRREARKT